MNKPLSREERALIVRAVDGETVTHVVAIALTARLLEAEAFWREAVKNCVAYDENADCIWCDGHYDSHKPDCAWLLAQES